MLNEETTHESIFGGICAQRKITSENEAAFVAEHGAKMVKLVASPTDTNEFSLTELKGFVDALRDVKPAAPSQGSFPAFYPVDEGGETLSRSERLFRRAVQEIR